MSKAERFLEENVRNDSNIMEGYHPNGKQAYFPWIPLRHARKAVEIAREEAIEKVKELLLSEVLPCFMHGGEADEVVAMLDDKIMKDE